MQKEQPLVGEYIFSTISKQFGNFDQEEGNLFVANVVASFYVADNSYSWKGCVIVNALDSEFLSRWPVTEELPCNLRVVHKSYIIGSNTGLFKELL